MNLCELTVDDTHYFMESVPDSEGEHYVKDGITTVLDFRQPLVVVYKNTESHLHPLLLTVREDEFGNEFVAIPLAPNIMLFMRGLFYIDANFIKRLEETSLHEFVKNKEGCYAISGFEIIETMVLRTI